MKKTLLALVAATLVIPATPALAQPHHSRHQYSNAYDSHGRYREPHRVRHGDKIWRGKDNRYYCKRDNGTTGLIVGAAGGALLGRTVDTRGDRSVGTIVGAVAGGLLGREIDRGEARCR
jgi:outer membrane lipoprotein SlyB